MDGVRDLEGRRERERENTQSTRKIEITETGRQRRENEGE